MKLITGKGTEITISSDTTSTSLAVSSTSSTTDNSGAALQGTLTYNGINLYPSVYKEQIADKVKVYDGGVMIALGDSFTAMMTTNYLTPFAAKHGLVLDAQGLSSSKIARPEGEGNDTIKSFVTRLDEDIATYNATGGKTINGKAYTADDVKLVTFMGGANDWTTIDTSKNIDRVGNAQSTDSGTIYGATDYCLSTILSTFKNADVIAILQPFADGYLRDLKEGIVREIAERYSIPVCDACFNFGYSQKNATELTKMWQSDKLHLTNDGWQEIINRLEHTLNNLDRYRS